MSRKHDAGKTLERLRATLHYDPLTGNFYQKKTGAVAGCNDDGYIVVYLGGDRFKGHHLAWLWTYGEWPKQQIDHINRVRSDNRIANLRDVNHSVNARNSKMLKTNTSGHVGVSWHKQKQKWGASIRINGKSRHLGLYASAAEAALVYQLALQTL